MAKDSGMFCLLMYGLLLWGNICFTAQTREIEFTKFGRESNDYNNFSANLEVYFAKKDNKYIKSARCIYYNRNRIELSNFSEYSMEINSYDNQDIA